MRTLNTRGIKLWLRDSLDKETVRMLRQFLQGLQNNQPVVPSGIFPACVDGSSSRFVAVRMPLSRVIGSTPPHLDRPPIHTDTPERN